VHAEQRKAIVAVLGGDSGGRPGDMKTHSGSPLRAFMQADDCYRAPVELLPFALVDRLLQAKLEVTVVGFSQGSIAALAVAMEHSSIAKCVLFNPANMFWPPWLRDRLGCPAVTSYVVEGDPLSDGVRDAYRAPRVAGVTTLLPTRAKGFDNHYLHWFLPNGAARAKASVVDDDGDDVDDSVSMARSTDGLLSSCADQVDDNN